MLEMFPAGYYFKNIEFVHGLLFTTANFLIFH